MAIPKYTEFFLPMLKLLAESQSLTTSELVDFLSKEFELDEAELMEVIPSGKQTVVRNRVAWARTYLKKAGLLESPKRGFITISQRGLEVIKKNPQELTLKFLEQYPEFIEFRSRKKRDIKPEKDENLHIYDGDDDRDRTPTETLDLAYQKIRDQLASDLVDLVKIMPPKFFEILVVDLLLAMGYGGSRKDAGEAIGKSGDEGIDGKISEDRLGLDTIYIQAKRWEATVGRPEIQKFAGALQGQKAKKGVYITTSDYTSGAREFAAGIENTIILINGEQLAQYMIDFNIGVSTEEIYEIKKIDSDYFEEI